MKPANTAPRAHAVARTNMHPTRNGLQVAHQPWIFTMCQVVVDMQCLLMRWPDYMLLNGLIYGVATSSAAPHNPSWPFHRAMVLHTICAIKMWVNCPYVILDDGHPGFHQPIWCGDFPIETSSHRWVSAWFPSVFSMIFHDGNPTVSVFQGPKGFHHNLWHSHWPFWGPSPTAPDLQHWRRRRRPFPWRCVVSPIEVAADAVISMAIFMELYTLWILTRWGPRWIAFSCLKKVAEFYGLW